VEVIRSHGATIVFEGIEEDVHLAIARESGGDLVQGYLLARPASEVSVKSSERLGARDSEAPSGFRNRPSSKLGSGS
jgi:EAL domain-containing protein (putative c-di-GMP-specific phosphodiesterase class I)